MHPSVTLAHLFQLFFCFYVFLKSIPLTNRPPLPPQPTNQHQHQHWENGSVRRTDSFSSVSSPPPSCYPNQMNHRKPFIDQAQASGMTPMRRTVPMPPGNLQSRNQSASVFNLNQGGGGYPQPFQQQPSWGMNPMNQVCKKISINTINGLIKLSLKAHSMAQLNMMGNQWGMTPQGWSGNNFNHGSNMSLNVAPIGFEPQMWNPWMQQQQQPQFSMMPMMPNGKHDVPKTTSAKFYS